MKKILYQTTSMLFLPDQFAGTPPHSSPISCGRDCILALLDYILALTLKFWRFRVLTGCAGELRNDRKSNKSGCDNVENSDV